MGLSEEVKTQTREKLGVLAVFTLAQLMGLLSCSRRTAQRVLKEWGCVTSFNANAAYYALPETVRFDQKRIWRHGSVCFSAFGNLCETLIGVVQRAPEGMTAADLSEILGVNVNSFLSGFVRSGKLFREKVGPRFVYFSTDEQVRKGQVRKRREVCSLAKELSLVDAIVVLVEFITSPTLGPGELASAVRSRAPTASGDAIELFFTEHGLQFGKKRASRSQL